MTADDRERAVLESIERRRRRPPRLTEDRVTLAHGAGGKASHALVEAVFMPELTNPALDARSDFAAIAAGPAGAARLAFSTDAFVVRPLVFPGGDIGELAVNGTVNDLAMSGGRPLCLSAAFVIEEGFRVDDLRAIAASMARAARRAGVPVVCGDTKVVEREKADGLYVTTAGIALVHDGLDLGPHAVRPGDAVLVSGTLGDHGMAILIARGDLELDVELDSDTAPLDGLVSALLAATGGVRCLRDPTRGGLATVMNELALAADVGIALTESALPVRPEVTGACEILGIDPLDVANEGKLVAVVAAEEADDALAAMRSHPLGADAALVGTVVAEPAGLVTLRTAFGGSRVVEMLVGDPLPRIC